MKKIENPVNPYNKFNRHVANSVRMLNKNNHAIDFYFVPKVHPILDEKNALDKVIDENTVMIKVHGLATHTVPTDIAEWICGLARELDIPLIVHTDYLNHRKIQESILDRLCRENSPMAYIQWAIKSKVKLVLNHGARLDPEAIHIVNNEESLMLMSGPDCHLESRPDHLAIETKDYVKSLFSMASPDKVMFSSDFAWNVSQRGIWQPRKWDSVQRIQDILSHANAVKVLRDNAINFLKLPR